MLPPNIIIPFDGNHSDIPSGWERYIYLDGKYPKSFSSLETVGSSGGADTHTHTSPAHTHTVINHAHNFQTSSDKHETFEPGGGGQQTASGSQSGCGNGTHYHSGTSSATYSSSPPSLAVTYSAQSNHPPYYEVIFIKSLKYNLIPNNGMIFNKRVNRKILTFHTASANRYLRGATTEANAGSIGGSTTNSHSISHNHSVTHYHTGTSSPPSSGATLHQEGNNPQNEYSRYHSHPIILNATVVTSSSNDVSASQVETVEPSFGAINIYKNSTGNETVIDVGDIAIWTGSDAEIPVGWVICDGSNNTPDLRGRFIKNNASLGVFNTGGSNTHIHEAQLHSHTIPVHTHTGYALSGTAMDTRAGDGHNYWSTTATVQHGSMASVSTNSGTLSSEYTTANPSDNQPPYIVVTYIMATNSALGGTASVISNFLG